MLGSSTTTRALLRLLRDMLWTFRGLRSCLAFVADMAVLCRPRSSFQTALVSDVVVGLASWDP